MPMFARGKNFLVSARPLFGVICRFLLLRKTSGKTLEIQQPYIVIFIQIEYLISVMYTCINSKPYQLSPSSKLLPLSTKRHSTHIFCILTDHVLFSFRLTNGTRCFVRSLVLPYARLQPQIFSGYLLEPNQVTKPQLYRIQ